MKKLLLIFSLALAICTQTFAQQDVTKFLGIPVDGTKQEMIQKLKAKGFTSNPYSKDFLSGKFNGQDVTVGLVDNNGKVYRVLVMFPTTKTESDIIIFFNNLYRQFSNNSKYKHAFETDQTIPEGEDISYEINVKNKRYEADFFQLPEEGCEQRYVWFMIVEQYSDYQVVLFYDNMLNAANGEDL